MRSKVGWVECRVCGHLVNPRSERCDEAHELCTVEGCMPAGQYPGMVFPGPLDGVDVDGLWPLPADTQTLQMVDIASYQRGINLGAVRAAGYTLVNIKTSQGGWYQFADAVMYARAAQQLGMGISAFHWLDDSTDGVTQARYCWQVLSEIIGAVGHPVGLQCDNEDAARPASLSTTLEFVGEINRLAGHRPYMYSGDWYATAAGRAGWNFTAVAPWLMGAPNAGYLPSYPGDGSGHWVAQWWGYEEFGLLQYAVSPIDGAGGGSISKTAIRDPNIWVMIAGGKSGMEQTDPIKGAATRGNSIGDAFADGVNLRDEWYLPLDKHSKNPPGPGSRFDLVVRAAEAIIDGAVGAPTDAQVEAQAARIAAALVAAGVTGLTAEAVKGAVKAALREGSE